MTSKDHVAEALRRVVGRLADPTTLTTSVLLAVADELDAMVDEMDPDSTSGGAA